MEEGLDREPEPLTRRELRTIIGIAIFVLMVAFALVGRIAAIRSAAVVRAEVRTVSVVAHEPGIGFEQLGRRAGELWGSSDKRDWVKEAGRLNHRPSLKVFQGETVVLPDWRPAAERAARK